MRRPRSLRRRALLLGRGAERFERKLTWIFGSPRSGSTWLLGLLGDLPEVLPFNEPLIGLYLGPFLSDLPGGDAAALSTANCTLRRAQRDLESAFFADAFSDVWVPALRRMMQERFLEAMLRDPSPDGTRRRLIVIKEPNGSQSADVIMRALPSSRLLFLLRDGRDVVDSELAGNRPGAWVSRMLPGLRGVAEPERMAFVVQSAHKWLWRTEVVQEAYARHQGPKLLIRYEDLLADTARQLRTILNWLEVRLSDEVIDELVRTHAFDRSPRAGTGPGEFVRVARPGAWAENLSEPEASAVESIIGPKLRELGYA